MSEKREIKHPDKTVSTGAYSSGVLCDGWLYVSGQGSLDYKTGEVLPGTIAEETTRTLEHVEKIIQAAGGTMADIVKCIVHLESIGDFDKFNDTYAAFFKSRGVTILPARTTVQSTLLDIKVEIDAVARIHR